MIDQYMFKEIRVTNSHASQSNGITFHLSAWVAMM